VIVCAHWGFEYEYWPAARQRAHAVRLIELGADLIVGSSPHVLQPVELVSIDGADPACPLQARRGGRPRHGLIAWSLGNFATIMPTLPCQVGALLEVELAAGAGGLSPRRLRAIPTMSRRGLGASWIGGATVLADDDARRHAASILGSLATMEGTDDE